MHLCSRIFTPPPKIPGRLTMLIPLIRDVRDGAKAESVTAQCHECAKLLSIHLYKWARPYPERSTVKQWNKETMSFVGLTIEDFQNFLMSNFILKTTDGKEWLADKCVADLIWRACTAADSPLPIASWQEETNRKRKAARN
jgi:hypothetical protein